MKKRSSKTKRRHLGGGFAPSRMKRKKPGRQDTNKDSALHYTQADLPVVPIHGSKGGRCTCGDADCKQLGRHPRTEQGIEDATTDHETIGGWWNQWPSAKIGIATNSIIAVTVTKGGQAAWRKLQQNHGTLPKTPQIRRGKLRIYLFRAPTDGILNYEVQLAKGVTFHGHGSYIIAPSKLDAPKSERHFVNGSAIGEIDFAPPPDWLLRLINASAGNIECSQHDGQPPSAAASPREIPFHTFAEIFPTLKGEQLKELANDIAERGLLNAIWLYEGTILDGRCRYLACKMAEVEPRYQNYVGDDPLGFVIGQNLHRRHLKESQRAMVAAKIADLDLGANQHSEGTSIDVASKSMNVSKSSVDRARKVRRDGDPEMIEAVESGKLKVSAAAARIGPSRSPKRKSAIEEIPRAANGDSALEATVEKDANGHLQLALELPESPPTIPKDAEADDLAIPPFLDRRVSTAVRAADRAEFAALLAAWDRATELKRVLRETCPAVLEQFIDLLRTWVKKVEI
jgi:ParB-like chromosome segregation protein Spo0J